VEAATTVYLGGGCKAGGKNIRREYAIPLWICVSVSVRKTRKFRWFWATALIRLSLIRVCCCGNVAFYKLSTSQALFLIGPQGKGVERLGDQVHSFSHSLMGAPGFGEASTSIDSLVDYGKHLPFDDPPKPQR
jgi:hypothetical protein